MSPTQPATDNSASLGRVVVYVLAALDAIATVGWLVYTLRWAPAFLVMFADFVGEIAISTRIAVHPAWGGSLTAGCALATLCVATLPRTWTRRAALLGVVLVVATGLFGVSMYALYLPIFQMTDNLR